MQTNAPKNERKSSSSTHTHIFGKARSMFCVVASIFTKIYLTLIHLCCYCRLFVGFECAVTWIMAESNQQSCCFFHSNSSAAIYLIHRIEHYRCWHLAIFPRCRVHLGQFLKRTIFVLLKTHFPTEKKKIITLKMH